MTVRAVKMKNPTTVQIRVGYFWLALPGIFPGWQE
jgi:hypothetical protein